MPKVFGFLGKLSKRQNAITKEIANKLIPGPIFSELPQKKQPSKRGPVYFNRTRPSRAVKKLMASTLELHHRREKRRIQAAKSKTIRNDYLKLQLEEAQDNYQASLASQRAISAANLQRELAEFGVGK